MTTIKDDKKSQFNWRVFGYALLIPVVIVLFLPVIPILILYTVITEKYFIKKFRRKYPSKRFLIINKNDPEFLRAYSETIKNKIDKDSVVLNEIDLEKEEFNLERSLYRSGLSWHNYLPVLIHIDKTINRTGLYYAFKDYLKGKRKRINKILKNLHKLEK